MGVCNSCTKGEILMSIVRCTMKKLLIVWFSAVAFQANLAQADIQMARTTPNKMVKTCTAQDEAADLACRSFLTGVIDSTRFYANAQLLTPAFCIPAETDSSEILSVYRGYIVNNHSLNRFSAAALAVSAFKNAYPCK